MHVNSTALNLQPPLTVIYIKISCLLKNKKDLVALLSIDYIWWCVARKLAYELFCRLPDKIPIPV